jgi:hypothetical protein
MNKLLKQCAAVIAVFVFCAAFIPFSAGAEPEYDCAAGRHKDVVIARAEPTDLTDGFETFRCELCGREYEAVLYATAHLWGDWMVDLAPTCTEPGRRHRTCTRETHHDDWEVIPALGHDYILTITPPTCTEDGLKTYVCSRDGTTYTEPGEPALGHEYVGSITKEPSCTEDGETTFICAHDPAFTYTEPVPAIGHKFGGWAVETPAKEKTPGLEVRVCEIDGAREERELPALPNRPLFNVVDAVAAGANVGIIGLFALLLIPTIRTVNKERRAYKAFKRQKESEETEAKKHDFH